MKALSYLQASVSSCVNHKDQQEEKFFQTLPSSVFSEVRLVFWTLLLLPNKCKKTLQCYKSIENLNKKVSQTPLEDPFDTN